MVGIDIGLDCIIVWFDDVVEKVVSFVLIGFDCIVVDVDGVFVGVLVVGSGFVVCVCQGGFVFGMMCIVFDMVVL